MKKAMHAKHADGDSLDEPSGNAISFAVIVHNALAPAYTARNQTRTTSGPANHVESSACFACIVFFIYAKILSCVAVPQGLHRGSRTDASAAARSGSIGRIIVLGTGPLDWCHEIGVGGGPADALGRTQPASGVRYNTGLMFL
jgi:hypothetical protein